MTEDSENYLVIVGAGGFGLEVAAYAEDIIRMRGIDFRISGFLDDTKPRGAVHGGYPVLGNTEEELDPQALYVIALGWPAHRRALTEKLKERGAKFATFMHPAAYIASTATIGVGSIIAPFAFVGPQAVLGAQVVANVGAVVGHEAQVGDCSVLAPHADVHGAAVLDANVFIGSGATVTNGKRVGAGSKISAGAVVFQDIPAGVTALGNPAKARIDNAA